MTTEPRLLVDDGICFPEGPRWHDGHLYYSDFYGHTVSRVDMDGKAEVIAEIPQQPSGMDWLPDGSHLVVSMLDSRLMKLNDGAEPTVFADLREYAPYSLNDMIVTRSGRIFVGGMPKIDPERLGQAEPQNLVAVETSGEARVVAGDMSFPNGIVETADGKTLIVAETFGAGGLTAFDIEDDGSLSNRRTWAEVPFSPDGICIDSEDCVWAAAVLPDTEWGAVRIAPGGEIVDHVRSDQATLAVALGGPDGRTLFMVEAATFEMPGMTEPGNGRIRYVEVGVPAAA